jgi:uncharacterized protein involved in copper resistance
MKRSWTLLPAAVAALILLACQPKATEPAAPAAASAKSAAAATKATPCVNQCLARRQMKAMSIEAIERECRASCDKECMDACRARSAMRAVSADAIDADCKRACGQ